MSKWRNAALVAGALAALGGAVAADGPVGRYGIGRPATEAEIAAWDIDVRPDGHGVRKGRGSVREGQALFDAKCASCHGTFGESNAYQVILAGGVEKSDIERGRVAALARGDQRTTGSKLNHASTLWDYIYRAMPWTAPQSLTVDETYALTAYVLHLNEIVDEDFVLDDTNLLKVRMPNRDGMTTNHGMGSVRGKPDVQGSLCMRDCAPAPKIVSSLPDYARNVNGNLALQTRPRGPVRGIDTTRYDPGAAKLAASGAAAASAAPPNDAGAKARELLGRHACTSCHSVDQRLVGPAFAEVRGKYRDRSDAQAYLAARIRSGGSGVWGAVPMPPQPGVAEAEADTLAQWILGGAQ